MLLFMFRKVTLSLWLETFFSYVAVCSRAFLKANIPKAKNRFFKTEIQVSDVGQCE